MSGRLPALRAHLGVILVGDSLWESLHCRSIRFGRRGRSHRLSPLLQRLIMPAAAFALMLRIVAWDSRRARTIPVRSPLSKVTPALSMATSVPGPMAMPTSDVTTAIVLQSAATLKERATLTDGIANQALLFIPPALPEHRSRYPQIRRLPTCGSPPLCRGSANLAGSKAAT
jgi:hypothetical protein